MDGSWCHPQTLHAWLFSLLGSQNCPHLLRPVHLLQDGTLCCLHWSSWVKFSDAVFSGLSLSRRFFSGGKCSPETALWTCLTWQPGRDLPPDASPYPVNYPPHHPVDQRQSGKLWHMASLLDTWLPLERICFAVHHCTYEVFKSLLIVHEAKGRG